MSYWLCFFAFLIATSHVANCFPQDLIPNLVLSLKDTSTLPVFRAEGWSGRKQWNLDVQEIKLIDGKILVLSGNAVYVVPQSSFTQATGSIVYEQVLEWEANRRSRCRDVAGAQDECRNDIRLMAQVSNRTILLCATTAKDQSCRKYQWTGSQFTGRFQSLDEGKRLLVPTDQTSDFSYQYSDGYVFNAIQNGNPSLSRIAVGILESSGSQTSALPYLQTENSPEWLKQPNFIGMVNAGDKVFIFFREQTLETVDAGDKMVVSRVAQLCKNDGGTATGSSRKWTSFFKARLNCSVPGIHPFHFNELQHVTEAVMFDGEATVFATFTTPENSITGSAICAFSLSSIETSMRGPFRKLSNNGTGNWKTVNWSQSASSPTSCLSRKGNQMLDFIKDHRFMADGVQPVTPSPLMISTTARYSVVALETNQDMGTAMLYIGTSDGKLLKVTTQEQLQDATASRESVLSEVWEVYRPEECRPKGFPTRARSRKNVADKDLFKKVMSIVLLPEHILVSFKHCVISVPKKACWHYKCERSCAQSGNPYCGWDSSGYCVPVSFRTQANCEQDLFKQKIYNDSCGDDVAMTSHQTCVSILEVILPLVLGMTVMFFILLLLVICYERRRKKHSGGTRLRSKNGHKKSKSKGHRALLVRHTKDDPLQVTIEATTPIEPLTYDRPKIGSPQPLNNLNMNCNYGTQHLPARQHQMTSYKEQTNSSCDDTEWSVEFSDSYDHLATKQPRNAPPQDGSKSKYFYPNRSNQKLNSLKSNTLPSPSKIRLGAGSSSNYGSLITRTKDSKHLEKSRIMTNPNYLPVTPCVSRTTDSAKPTPVENMTSPELTTFSSNWGAKERLKLIPESDRNFDLNFPRPPSCVLQDSQNFAVGGHKPKSTPASGSYPLSECSVKKEEERKHSISSSSKMSCSLSPDDILAPSYAGSTTSGFVSSTSPLDPVISPSSRKAIIVAKGILSAQSTLASPNTRRNKKKKKLSGVRSGGPKEHIYDEPFHSNSSACNEKESSQESSQSSETKGSDEMLFPSPEFLQKSDDEKDDDNIQRRPAPAGLPFDGKSGKNKKRIFKGGKNRKEKFLEKINDETFTSPAFDEDPEIPVVQGWQEINYNPRFSALQSKEGSHYYDDSCLAKKSDHLGSSPFYTMRPKNRMRQKMPKLRNTTKEWNAKNNPVPVPTPVLPDP